jgi:hypothetical protein
MSTPYESLAHLAHERVARLSGEALDARRVADAGAPAEVERSMPLNGALSPCPLTSAVPIRRLLPIRLP